jgi:hypothetical protein
LQRKTKLNTEKSETHVPDLPEAKAGFGRHSSTWERGETSENEHSNNAAHKLQFLCLIERVNCPGLFGMKIIAGMCRIAVESLETGIVWDEDYCWDCCAYFCTSSIS